MASSALGGAFAIEAAGLGQQKASARTGGPGQEQRPVRRRGSLQQGRALETLGHAVEYLVDSRMFAADELSAQNDQEAIQILMRLSRAVFAECPEIVPIQQRMSRWFVDRLTPAGRRRTRMVQGTVND